VAAVGALHRNGDRERLGKLRATHPFALAFPYVLLTVLPLYHAKTYKESDVRNCLFHQFIFPVLYQLFFQRISPGGNLSNLLFDAVDERN